MTRDQLLDRLLAERYEPIPAHHPLRPQAVGAGPSSAETLAELEQLGDRRAARTAEAARRARRRQAAASTVTTRPPGPLGMLDGVLATDPPGRLAAARARTGDLVSRLDGGWS